MSFQSRTPLFIVLALLLAALPAAVAAPASAGGTDAVGATIPINGMEMYVETVGEGEPLVLLHGFTRSCRAFDPFVEALAARYRLIIPDLRGHGGSTNPGGTFTMQQSARDVLALLDHLGVERCQGIGISAGAVTLLHVATAHPERVEAMVLVGSGSRYPDHCREQLAQLSARTYSEAEMDRLRAIHRHGDEQIRALLRQLGELAGVEGDLAFTPEDLSAITARALLVHGDRDYCFPVPMVAEMYAAIPEAYLWVVPYGGHVPIYGSWAGPFTETVLAFLGGAWR
ncbi:MAG: alpha/beta fold hydrolase [Candidatus Krumholzibacteriota bacterium]|nr:alpha/beta fold hydrolase [Candidatus Krumholzibacteriota bacterium]